MRRSGCPSSYASTSRWRGSQYLVAAGLSLRRAFPSGAAWKSALVGGAVGLFCGATMNLHCPSVDAAHVSLAHGIPVLVASALGALLLGRWVRA